jgi:hypothetical protein
MERLAGSGTADVLEYWFTTWETLALPAVPPVAPKSLVIQSCVTGAMSICWLSAAPGLDMEKILQPVLNPVVQYFSEKSVIPVPTKAPLKAMKRSEIVVPGAAVTTKEIVASWDWPGPSRNGGVNKKPSFPSWSIGETPIPADVGVTAPPPPMDENWKLLKVRLLVAQVMLGDPPGLYKLYPPLGQVVVAIAAELVKKVTATANAMPLNIFFILIVSSSVFRLFVISRP